MLDSSSVSFIKSFYTVEISENCSAPAREAEGGRGKWEGNEAKSVDGGVRTKLIPT